MQKGCVKRLTDAVRNSVAERNWYSSLALALALPDILGFLESPSANSQRRYVGWCDRFLVPRYTSRTKAKGIEHVFLSGEDCYALRCAFLHEGSDDIVHQTARKALESFLFIEPPPSGSFHCNQSNAKLLLQVDIFCRDICDGVDDWSSTVLAAQPEIQVRALELLTIRSMEQRLVF